MARINEQLENKKNTYHNKGIKDKDFIQSMQINMETMREFDSKYNDLRVNKKTKEGLNDKNSKMNYNNS